MNATPVTGVLLAAGEARRFGGDKLCVALRGAARVPIGVAAYRTLARAIAESIVVVRPDDVVLRALFEREGAHIVVAPDASEGLSRSLAAGVSSIDPASGVVVALADMPWIEATTIAAVARSIAKGASIAAPRFRGQRGHPVGFGPGHRAALLGVRGDEGARTILAAHAGSLTLIDVNDPGVLRDIDTPDDMERGPVGRPPGKG